jgi:hypothetical protein
VFIPAVVREGAVGFGHLVGVFALLHRGTAVGGGVEEFAGELLGHGVFAAVAGGVHQPADGQRPTTVGADFHRNLISRAADPAGADFDRRSDVVQGGVEGLQRTLVLALGFQDVEGAVDDVLGDGFFALVHHVIHELGDDQVPELRVGQNLAFLGAAAAGHTSSSLLRTLGAVERTTLAAVLHALRIEHTAQDVVADAGKVLHATPADEHHGVLLQVVAFAGDVAHGFDAGGQAHLGDLTKR